MVFARNGKQGDRRPAIVLVTLVEATAVVLAIGIALVVGPTDETPTARPGPDPTTGSTTTPSTPPSPVGSTVPVIRPGRPGESADVVAPNQLTPQSGPRHNSADVLFVQMMVPHHEQALQMAALVPTRAGGTGVISVADRIRASQQPEVEVLRSWLRDRSLPPDVESGHEHHTMHGMQSPAAIAALTSATGTAFDRMFIEMMSAHHQGAIQMAQAVLTAGVDPQIRELARNIAFEQAVEINRMREVIDPQVP
ncbi:DUF305 domain-containing protein [Plantactinospora soyae]|uniref:Uncharacterized protein (DUF305 family) n=1 Tax=Plantactinospora soyae TaxID=1544732 RepID=A0A927R4W6_9ACTN|nr:DUF305 domain-containing protein [Plantactinospora soyae]MBE1486929.1 uncharacterized protein (DUF305 family) [Plantactinospora soyae]